MPTTVSYPRVAVFSSANLNGYPWRVQPIWHLHLVWLVFYDLADERQNKRVRATAKKGASMKINQAAAASGLTVKTVRY